MTTADATATPVQIDRWPTEIPLLIGVVLASLFVWMLLALTIFGLIYVLLIGAFLFVLHLMLVTHIRGSAVKLGPEQFPEIYDRVVALAGRAGLAELPEAYLMEAGGSLNAFATRFFRSRIVVLYSDLLEACGDDEKAKEMIIGHELGHIHAGHLNFAWLLAPGLVMPFLGQAYSRARELTCDRYGAALCGDLDGAKHGLAILAAGGNHGKRVNLASFVAQSKNLDTGWMTLGKWLSNYPPLCERVGVLDPALKPAGWVGTRGPVRAILILGAFFAAPMLATFVVMAIIAPRMEKLFELPAVDEVETQEPYFEEDVVVLSAQAQSDFVNLGRLIQELHRSDGGEELGIEEVRAEFERRYPADRVPLDPFDDLDYGYYETDTGFVLWSIGPDREVGSEDDLIHTEDWIDG